MRARSSEATRTGLGNWDWRSEAKGSTDFKEGEVLDPCDGEGNGEDSSIDSLGPPDLNGDVITKEDVKGEGCDEGKKDACHFLRGLLGQ